MQNVKCKKHNISLNVKFECWFSIHFTFIYYYKMLQIYELRIDQYIILDFFTQHTLAHWKHGRVNQKFQLEARGQEPSNQSNNDLKLWPLASFDGSA